MRARGALERIEIGREVPEFAVGVDQVRGLRRGTSRVSCPRRCRPTPFVAREHERPGLRHRARIPPVLLVQGFEVVGVRPGDRVEWSPRVVTSRLAHGSTVSLTNRIIKKRRRGDSGSSPFGRRRHAVATSARTPVPASGRDARVYSARPRPRAWSERRRPYGSARSYQRSTRRARKVFHRLGRPSRSSISTGITPGCRVSSGHRLSPSRSTRPARSPRPPVRRARRRRCAVLQPSQHVYGAGHLDIHDAGGG